MSAEWVQVSTIEEWSRRARAGGPDHEVADCGSESSHLRRLRALLCVPMRPGDSVEDLGCGTGRLADLLPEDVTYEGLDWSEEVVELARQRRPGKRFRVGGVAELRPADWILASGPFNYAQGWRRDLTALAVRTMWAHSRKGIALTALRVPSSGRLAYTPEELIGYVAGCDWDAVHVDRSYLPNDLCFAAWRVG
jgi:SAM-dependent methyltransferase